MKVLKWIWNKVLLILVSIAIITLAFLAGFGVI